MGAYHRQKYAEEHNLFTSSEYVEGEVIVITSDSDRTKQSAFSELMGLYPPGKDLAWQLSEGELLSVADRGMPGI